MDEKLLALIIGGITIMAFLKRVTSLILDTITIFGYAAEMLRIIANALDAIKNLYNYPPKD